MDIIFPDTVPEEFWDIIEKAQQDPLRFRAIIKKINRQQLLLFYWTYEELANWLRTEYYSSNASRNLSEDGMSELANWVVAQGKEYYHKIFNHPELIPSKKDDLGFLSEAIEEYEQRYKSDLPSNTNEWDDDWLIHGKKSPWL